jgi:hypothetical protein
LSSYFASLVPLQDTKEARSVMAGYLAPAGGPGRAGGYLFAATFAAPYMAGQFRHRKQAAKPVGQRLAGQLSIMAALVAPAKNCQPLLLQISERDWLTRFWLTGFWPTGFWPAGF